jgi:pimeloyl-ACP methyl ester carboxylesterase
VAGVFEDIRLIGKESRLDLSRVKAPVGIWHGDQDKVAPIANAEPLYRLIPRAQVTRVSGEGHFLFYRHEQEILAPF